jgi:peptidyl-prolyl cis-trans isomerase C
MPFIVRLMSAISLGYLLVFSGCQTACNKKLNNDNKNGDLASLQNVAAIVNGANLSISELDVLHKRAVTQMARANRPVNPELDRKLRASILRKMIDDEILKQSAEKEGVKVDRLERVEAFENYKERMGGAKGLETYLAQQNLTEEQLMTTLAAELQRDKLIQKLSVVEEPTEDEIKNHFLANQRLYTLQEMVRARHILVKLSPNEPQEKADLALKKTQQILQEASLPNASFEALVQKYSEGPSVKTGGDLGFFSRGKMVKSFEDAAFSAPLKKPVGPIKTDFGYHIIYVEEKTPPKVAELEHVRDRIVDFIKHGKRSRKSEELLYSFRKEANIAIKDQSLTKEEYDELSEKTKLAIQNANAKTEHEE